MFIQVKPNLSGYLNSKPCSLVRQFLFNCTKSQVNIYFPVFASEMNFDGTNNSITLEHKVKRTYSPVSPVWHICLLLNLPSLCIIRS